MKKIPVVIVEDRALARDELKYLLKTYHPDIEVIGEFEEPASAWEMIASEPRKVDGVFLDINFEQQGEEGGLQLARKFRLLDPVPWIIFVTGHREYAVDGYDFRTFGYILKPIDELKLETALNKVREVLPIRLPTARIEMRHKVIRETKDGHIERIFLNKFLLPEEILYVRSNDSQNTVKVHLLNDSVLDDVNIRLNQWMDFELADFAQIRRNTLVNLKHVSGFRPDPERTDGYLLQFKNSSEELPIGDHYFAAFKTAIKRCV